MPEINTHIPLDIHIHRHNGRADDVCEVTVGHEPKVLVEPANLRAYLANEVEAGIPERIQSITGIEVAPRVVR